ncbi:MAG: hypothetical protein D6720_01825 [Gammaproteobacteria bacterium]|nr:MAG: hypothetical protein D6720_01825 [Gammaproteobacteria bacterium]
MSRLNRMLEKISHLLGRKPPERATCKQLRKLLKRLKHRQRELEKRCKYTHDAHERKRLEREIKVIREQRRKGVHLYRELRK